MLKDDDIETLKERGFKDGNEWFTSYATEEDRFNAGSDNLNRVGVGRAFYDWMMVEYPEFFQQTTDETYGNWKDDALRIWSQAFMDAARDASP